MNKVVIKKINILQDIFNSYEKYKGVFKTMLEVEITKLKGVISEEDYNNLINSFQLYKQQIINILANSRRVYLDFNDMQNVDFKQIEQDFENLEKMI